MPEREGAQERPQRRWRHHPERQHHLRGAGAEPVRVIDVGSADQDRRHQREDLAARVRATDPVDQTNHVVDQRLKTEANHQRGRHDQPCVGHQARIIEDRLDAVDRARY